MTDRADLRTVNLEVDGRRYEREVEPRMLLSDFLRHELELTGTHVGCEHGVCGACTVIVDGRSLRSCLMFAVQANHCKVETIEGLAQDGVMHPLQRAFSASHGLQCGYCTPGMLMTLIELLRETPDPTSEEVRDAISGNLCRCTGYDGIVKAALSAAAALRAQGRAP